MAVGLNFLDLVHRAREGDEDAASELTREFQPFILRFVRFRMRNLPNYDRLRTEVDSVDICQSVLKSLFVGLRKGRFELIRPEQLKKLLSAMIRFKIATKARKLSVRLREILDVDLSDERTDSAPGPEKPVEDKDLLEIIIKQFSEDELGLLIRRLDDQPWFEIAAELGGTPDALRKQLARAIERVREHFEA